MCELSLQGLVRLEASNERGWCESDAAESVPLLDSCFLVAFKSVEDNRAVRGDALSSVMANSARLR